ncbi:MAG: hypothetical protein JF625_29035 [Inquilinus limosus]|uniref:Uncharacterized protein n=1 Tax=Inquilinus limosus TaxID=171674 RepID=A0A952FVV8_9PROT|nr:hypothetical protein [Inquilinus limosus]
MGHPQRRRPAVRGAVRQQADDPHLALAAAGQPGEAAGQAAQEDKAGSKDHRIPTPLLGSGRYRPKR